ncbi:tripeptide aminopeptidase [Robiginitalea myxolifaciens]|uniref:Peptidase T n=1 Tax=Robiginitalea myxolifaciens TaxID=400055 RepID=A0A1I6H956_9FLAO|nr:peptidase T [Robiginitalea myxolifaciens]SFR50844.1 tripeptide aminopeptidase [Robiginitalea myxolifaciens]
MKDLLGRFLRYVRIHTTSDPNSASCPSTDWQWDLARLLEKELKALGMEEVSLDANGYLTATLPANVPHPVPVIGFISHYDTSPDYSGKGVNPRVIENYDGSDIILHPETQRVLSPKDFPELLAYKGQQLVVTDGTTLLGADDKAGVAEIVTAMDWLIQNPEIPHGKIRICFTPDEEIGRGAHLFDVEAFGAAWAYTLDGSQIGELEYENFNAAGARIEVTGKSVHPGYAKGKMINAGRVLQQMLNGLPQREVPEHTSGREGFFHVQEFQATIEKATARLLIRDHDRESFENRKSRLEAIVASHKEATGAGIVLEIEDQYYNMKEKIMPVFPIVEVAEEAMEACGVKPIIKPIRGGTDGSQLSFMGLPCPNIFAGGHNFHGPYEYVPVESMQKAVEVVVKICELTAAKDPSSWKKQKK